MHSPNMASLLSRRPVSPQYPELNEAATPVSEDLETVRALIAERVFLEESFGELLTATGERMSWDHVTLPEWLERMRVDGSPHETLVECMSRHLLSRSGKLFRATLILLSVRALSPPEERGPKLAAAMEIIHLATLLHDDVIDRADIRRGCPSLPSVYDNSPTVLMGDHLFARAFELIAECGHLGIISSSCRATSAMCRGEIEQLQWIHHADVTEEVYFRLIERKTAALMGSCTESAALLCGHNQEHGEWYRFGLTLGLLFQMTDDLLDFTGDERVFGKQTGIDVAAGKYTLPLILLRDRLGSPQALQAFLDSTPSPLVIRERLGSLGVFQEIRRRLTELAGACRHMLTELSSHCQDREAISSLEDLVEFVISRDH